MISRKHCVFQQNAEGQWTVKDNKVQRLITEENIVFGFRQCMGYAIIWYTCARMSMGTCLVWCGLPEGSFNLLQLGYKPYCFLCVGLSLGLVFFRQLQSHQGSFAVCEPVLCCFFKKKSYEFWQYSKGECSCTANERIN